MSRAQIALALLLGACASTPASEGKTRSTPDAPHTVGDQLEAPSAAPAWKRSCREYAQAPVSIRYEDAPGGAALVYRTEGDQVALQERTREVERFHNSAESKIGSEFDLSSIPHRAHVELLRDGARLVLVAKRPHSQALDRLRMSVQQEAFTMQRRGCGTGHEAL